VEAPTEGETRPRNDENPHRRPPVYVTGDKLPDVDSEQQRDPPVTNPKYAGFERFERGREARGVRVIDPTGHAPST